MQPGNMPWLCMLCFLETSRSWNDHAPIIGSSDIRLLSEKPCCLLKIWSFSQLGPEKWHCFSFVLMLVLYCLWSLFPSPKNKTPRKRGRWCHVSSHFSGWIFGPTKNSQAMKRGTYVVSILFTSLAMPSAALRHDEGNDGGGMMTSLGISCEVLKSPDSIHFTSSLGMFKSQVPVTVRCCCFCFCCKRKARWKIRILLWELDFFRPKKGRVEEAKNHFGPLSGKLDKQKTRNNTFSLWELLIDNKNQIILLIEKNPANHLW